MARTLFGTEKKPDERNKKRKENSHVSNKFWLNWFILIKMQGNKNHFMNFTYRFAIMFIILFELWYECQLNLS